MDTEGTLLAGVEGCEAAAGGSGEGPREAVLAVAAVPSAAPTVFTVT